jgi:RsiW-degrading membrane proteinase PrsW (M82 family)
MIFDQSIISIVSVITIAILPSLIWLFFYLKEDPHPEPRFWLSTVFILGMSLAPIVIFLEMSVSKFFSVYLSYVPWESGLLIFIIAPIVEEISKYGVVHLSMNKNPVMDEPVDGMIYLIVSALGFAAIENIFAVFSVVPIGADGYISITFNFMSMRFISAVALHGLASGITGYFFAKYYFPPKADPPLADIKRRPILILIGLFSAIVLHGTYNFLIVQKTESMTVIMTGIVLGGATALVIYLFNRLKYHNAYRDASTAVDESEMIKI